MITPTILKLLRKFSASATRARFQPAEIIRYGRYAFVTMSAEHYDWIKAASRWTCRISMRPRRLDAVKRATMRPEHEPLNKPLI